MNNDNNQNVDIFNFDDNQNNVNNNPNENINQELNNQGLNNIENTNLNNQQATIQNNNFNTLNNEQVQNNNGEVLQNLNVNSNTNINTNKQMVNQVPNQANLSNQESIVQNNNNSSNISNGQVQNNIVNPNTSVNQNQTQVNNQNMNNVPNQTINTMPNNTLNELKPKKKSNAGIIILIIFLLLLVVGGVAAFFIFFKGGSISGPKGVAKNYVKNIIDKNYQKNYDLVYLPENNFVDEKQYLNYLDDRDFSTIEDAKITSVSQTYKNDSEVRYIIQTKNKSGIITKNLLTLKLDYKKKWKVIEDDLYVSNWRIIIPKGTKLYFNDKLASEKLIIESSSIGNLEIMYQIPALAKEKYEVKLINDLGTTTKEITPVSSNNGEKIYMELTNTELINRAYEYIKNTWSEMYNAYNSSTNVSDVYNKYVDSDTLDVDSFNTIYTSFKTLIDNQSYLTNKDFKITEIVNREFDDDVFSNYIIDNDKITLNFGYRLNWTQEWNFSGSESKEMTRYSKLRLKVVGDSFKIYEIPDTKLFSFSNYFTRDY